MKQKSLHSIYHDFEILDPDCYKLPGHTPPCPSDNAPTTNR